jgi:hypothetical protein
MLKEEVEMPNEKAALGDRLPILLPHLCIIHNLVVKRNDRVLSFCNIRGV